MPALEVDPAARRYFCEQVASTLANIPPYNPIDLTLAEDFLTTSWEFRDTR